MFDFSESSTKSKYYDDSNKLVIDKIKNETASVAIEEVFGLKSKIYIYIYIFRSENTLFKIFWHVAFVS